MMLMLRHIPASSSHQVVHFSTIIIRGLFSDQCVGVRGDAHASPDTAHALLEKRTCAVSGVVCKVHCHPHCILNSNCIRGLFSDQCVGVGSGAHASPSLSTTSEPAARLGSGGQQTCQQQQSGGRAWMVELQRSGKAQKVQSEP